MCLCLIRPFEDVCGCGGEIKGGGAMVQFCIKP